MSTADINLALDALRTLQPDVDAFSNSYRFYEDFFDGCPEIPQLGMSLPPELKLLKTVVNWPGVVVNSIAPRISVDGFRLTGEQSTNEAAEAIWQANNLDAEQHSAWVETLVQGRAWWTVSANDENRQTPIILPESGAHMAVDWDTRRRRVRAAVRMWEEGNDGYVKRDRVKYATVYLPDWTYFLQRVNAQWVQYAEPQANDGVVPVVPMINDARLPNGRKPRAQWGRSELENVIPMTIAAARALTGLQGAQELLAVPSRYVLGATAEDFIDDSGQQIGVWEAYFGRLNAMANSDAKVVQLSAADLQNFTGVVQTYAKLAASVSRIPLRNFGVSSEANPASADAIRSDESPLVMLIKGKQRSWSGSLETVMRIALQKAGHAVTDSQQRLETVWADCETPTFAAKAQSLAQLWQAGLPIPRSYVYDMLNFTPEQRREADAQVSSDPMAQLLGGHLNADDAMGQRTETSGQQTGSAGAAHAAAPAGQDVNQG